MHTLVIRSKILVAKTLDSAPTVKYNKKTAAPWGGGGGHLRSLLSL